MRKIIGTAAATLAVAAAAAASATPANADTFGSRHAGGVNVALGDGSVRFVSNHPGSTASSTWPVLILPYIEQDSVYRQTALGDIARGDGSVRSIRYSTLSIQTWQAMGTRNGGEVVSDY